MRVRGAPAWSYDDDDGKCCSVSDYSIAPYYIDRARVRRRVMRSPYDDDVWPLPISINDDVYWPMPAKDMIFYWYSKRAMMMITMMMLRRRKCILRACSMMNDNASDVWCRAEKVMTIKACGDIMMILLMILTIFTFRAAAVTVMIAHARAPWYRARVIKIVQMICHAAWKWYMTMLLWRCFSWWWWWYW